MGLQVNGLLVLLMIARRSLPANVQTAKQKKKERGLVTVMVLKPKNGYAKMVTG